MYVLTQGSRAGSESVGAGEKERSPGVEPEVPPGSWVSLCCPCRVYELIGAT